MPDKHLFEYAVVRVVPRVEREEFLNVGVILYCPAEKFLKVRFDINGQRLNSFSKHIDAEEIKNLLSAFESICTGGDGAGPIGSYNMAERFRWLTASRSTIVQTSCVHPGLCDSAENMLSSLFEQLVM
jgi:hypothetical protein